MQKFANSKTLNLPIYLHEIKIFTERPTMP